MRALRGSGVSPLTTAPPGAVCFLVRSHPFMCATHYQSSCPPLPRTRLSVCTIVRGCVYFTPYLGDPVLPELERIQLGLRLRLTCADRRFSPVFFRLPSKRGQEERQNEWPRLFYPDNLYRWLWFHSCSPKPMITQATIFPAISVPLSQLFTSSVSPKGHHGNRCADME